MIRKSVLVLAVLLAVAVFVPNAFGCPVCYGDSDDQIIKGAEMSVLFMVGLTYVLLLGGAGMAFFVYRRRLRHRSAAGSESPQGSVAQDHEPALKGA